MIMEQRDLPQSKDWNHFWSSEKTKSFRPESWSKRRILRILSFYIKEGQNVLDAGCGSGFFSKYFSDQKMNVYSLDYSTEALEMTKALTSLRAVTLKKDLLNEDLSTSIEKRFDIIFSDGLFEHFTIDEQDKIMHNLKNVLSDNGRVITFIPNRWSPWQWIRPFLMPGIKERPLTIKELIDLNMRHNLVVKEQGGINVFPFSCSPDKILGRHFGMLLFTVSQKQ